MADEWIKMRRSLWEDGRVDAIIERLSSLSFFMSAERPQNVRTMSGARAQVVGALYRLWSLADQYAQPDGALLHTTKASVDVKVGIEGFCDALPKDWMEERDGVLYLPNYQEHNGSTAKRRATDAKRKRGQRDEAPQNVRKTSAIRPQSVRKTSASMRTRGEERRGEESRGESAPLTPNTETETTGIPLSPTETEKGISAGEIGTEADSVSALGKTPGFTPDTPQARDRLIMALAERLRLPSRDEIPTSIKTARAIQGRADWTDLDRFVREMYVVTPKDHLARTVVEYLSAAVQSATAEKPMAAFKQRIRNGGPPWVADPK